MSQRSRLLFLACGFPPAAKSSTYRLLEIGNQFAARDWDVTVVNAPLKVWEADTGIDLSLLDQVDPRITVVEAPVERAELESDISTFSEERALRPGQWKAQYRARGMEQFPEPAFGSWRDPMEKLVLQLHEENPFDLVVATCVPYVLLAAALRLNREHGVPFALDFRDGWSIDVVAGEVAFDRDSAEGRWEAEALERALSLWVVNEPIARHYRERYPELADKVHVVRNGFDASSAATVERGPSQPPLRFGYLGTVNFSRPVLALVLEAWRTACEQDPLLAGATLEFRGYMGAGARRGAHPYLQLIDEFSDVGVSYGGPVPKGDVGSVYGAWDALVLILIGGGFVTSGKVYEYMASALPIVSAHESEHDASSLLSDYPLWTGATDMDPEAIVAAFRRAAALAVEADQTTRAAARAAAQVYRRSELMAPAVDQLIERVARA